MKILNNARCTSSLFLLLAAVLLQVGGCAPPPASGNLQQRIDDLLQIQQQQAQQLTELKEQLAEMQTQPMAEATLSEAPETPEALSAGDELSETGSLNLPSAAAEIAEMSEAAGLYLESFAAIATSRMAEAEKGFRTFVERYPTHEYAGNARYWMAEALFALQKPQYAETILLEIIDNPDQANKAPAAMARLVRYYRETGAQSNADAMLQMLSSRYPENPELNRLKQSTELR